MKFGRLKEAYFKMFFHSATCVNSSQTYLLRPSLSSEKSFIGRRCHRQGTLHQSTRDAISPEERQEWERIRKRVIKRKSQNSMIVLGALPWGRTSGVLCNSPKIFCFRLGSCYWVLRVRLIRLTVYKHKQKTGQLSNIAVCVFYHIVHFVLYLTPQNHRKMH